MAERATSSREPRAGPARGAALERARLLVAMGLSIVAVVTLGIWDQRREAARALDDLAREQAVLAEVVASEVEDRVASGSPKAPDVVAAALRGLERLERDGHSLLLVAQPGRPGLVGRDGRSLSSEPLEHAVAQGAAFVTLERDDAARLGLPRRAAVAGLASFEHEGRWAVVTVASAQRLRERQRRAEYRLALGVLVVAGAVLGFGSVALRRARRATRLEGELGIAAIARERDAELQRAERMAALAALSTGVAHEIATPLSVLSARLEQLARQVPSEPRVDKSLGVMHEQVARIDRVMRGLLRLARGDAPALERAPAGELARTAAGLVAHRFREASVSLDVRADDDVAVAVDAPLFEQVLVNLLLNAAQASRAGSGVELRVAPEGPEAVFVVRDRGTGMSQAILERAAEPFVTTKPAGEGSGLGLAIATEIVKHHGGKLSIASGAGGTRVEVRLPLAPRSGA